MASQNTNGYTASNGRFYHAVTVYAANIHDTKSGILAVRAVFKKYPSIQRFCADVEYRKTFEQDVSCELGLGVDISVRMKPE